jgi:hypothetical protein
MAANDYATLDEARAYGYQSSEDDDPVLTAIITRASRIFDGYVGVADGYFAKGLATQTASARKFWGDGTNYLKVDPYLSSPTPTIAMPTGFDAPTFLESNPYQSNRMAQAAGEFFLVKTYGDSESRFEGLNTLGSDAGIFFPLDVLNTGALYVGWPDGIKVTVTAKWGFDQTPDDVKEAVLETTIAIWRGKDQAFARAVALETNVQINDALPPRAKLIADGYRVGRAVFA